MCVVCVVCDGESGKKQKRGPIQQTLHAQYKVPLSCYFRCALLSFYLVGEFVCLIACCSCVCVVRNEESAKRRRED